MELKELRTKMMKSKKDSPQESKVLQAMLSLCQIIAKEDGNRYVTPEDIVAAAKQEAKFAQQSKDLGAPYNECTFDITNSFLPQKMSADELKETIENIVSTNSFASMKDMGKVMATLKSDYKDLYDGSLASGFVKNALK